MSNKERNFHDFSMCLSSKLLGMIDRLSEIDGMNRSAYVDRAIVKAFKRKELPKTLPTKMVLDMFHRERRILLRLNDATWLKLCRARAKFGVPAAIIVKVILISTCW